MTSADSNSGAGGPDGEASVANLQSRSHSVFLELTIQPSSTPLYAKRTQMEQNTSCEYTPRHHQICWLMMSVLRHLTSLGKPNLGVSSHTGVCLTVNGTSRKSPSQSATSEIAAGGNGIVMRRDEVRMESEKEVTYR
jgi:hypothetical protein